MAFNNAYGAGMQDAYVKTAAGLVVDIEAIINVEGSPNQDDTDVKGDDTLKARFSSNRTEDITVTANAVSMDTIQAITGNTVTSSAGGSQVALGSNSELNAPYIELGATIQARDKASGNAIVIRKVWHKVQLNQIEVDAGNGNEFSLKITGTAYQTSTDIVGAALTSARVATLFLATS